MRFGENISPLITDNTMEDYFKKKRINNVFFCMQIHIIYILVFQSTL